MTDVADFGAEWDEMVRQLRIRHLVERGKGCCWPLWADNARPNFMFCGAPKVGPLSSYCLTHAKLACISERRAPARPEAQGIHAPVVSAIADVILPNSTGLSNESGPFGGASASPRSGYGTTSQPTASEFAAECNK